MITDEHLGELKEIFVKHAVVLAYLFGSQAEGTARPSSDVDIAVLLSPGTPRDRLFDVRLSLTNALMDVFHKDVDVAVLNEVNALVAREVVRYGILLFEDPATRPAVDFVVKASLYYADTSHFRRLAARYLGEHLNSHRLRLSASPAHKLEAA
ncbi:MAG: nucleotidyltransferase domain-containing protein [Chloroflexi bacterium]|nr:nucleotidyltransferase domain-containing protein [Chloroflexota bacterium]